MAVRSIYQHVSLELVLSSGQGRSWLKAPCAACLFVQYRAAPEDPYAQLLRAAAALQRVCAVVTCALGSAARPAHNALYRYAADGWRTAPCRPKRLAFRGFLGLFWDLRERRRASDGAIVYRNFALQWPNVCTCAQHSAMRAAALHR